MKQLSLSEWLGVGQFFLTAFVALLVWVWGRYRDLTLIIRRLDEIERRLDHAGRKTSDLASTMQGFPDRWRHDLQFETGRIWTAVDQLRSVLLGRSV
jgi:hypothetical protein